MDLNNVFSLLNGGLWQDYNGFLREEKENNNPIGKEILQSSYALVGLTFIIAILAGFIGPDTALGIFVFLTLFGVLGNVYKFILCAIKRKKISDNAYDIEVTPHKLKLIRNCEHRMGLCYWNTYIDNKLLLLPIYDRIVKGCSDSYILHQNGKYGIYSFNTNNIIAECVYDKIEVFSESIYILYWNGNILKMNFKGDRIMI